MIISFKRFLKNHYLIILILSLAAFLRFFNIEIKTSFLGEQGRDLLVARNILVFKKFTLLGPPTSLSPHIHFGPFYHYFNAFWLWLFRLNPLGPAIGFAFLNLLACLSLYLISLNWKQKIAGLMSALLFAVSPLMIIYSQSMFNSYFLISFTIFSFLSFSIFLNKQKFCWLFLSGLFAGIALQANFLAYGLIISFLIWFILQKTKFWLKSFSFIIGVLLATSPYLIFEVRHQFFNTHGFILWLREGGGSGFTLFGFFRNIIESFGQIFYFTLANQNLLVTILLIAFLTSLILLFKKKDLFLKLILLFLSITLVLARIYPGKMLDHYLGAVFPFVFLLFGYLFQKSLKSKFKIIISLIFAFIIFFNLSAYRFKTNNGYGMLDNWNMKETKKAAKIIANNADENFNIANLLDGDTRAYTYRYLVEIENKKPLGVEEYPQSKTLYVITKINQEQILDYPVWEIYSFLPAKIDKSWPIKEDIKIFKLIKE